MRTGILQGNSSRSADFLGFGTVGSAIDDAARKTAFVVVDLEGAASLMVAQARSRADLSLYTPTPRKSVGVNPSTSDSLRCMSGAILSPEDWAHFLRMMRHHTPSPVHRRKNAALWRKHTK